MINTYYDKEKNCLIIENLSIKKSVTLVKGNSCRPKYIGCDGNVYKSPIEYFNKFLVVENDEHKAFEDEDVI